MSKRFRVIPGVGIADDLTGKNYKNYREICKILNDVNKKADENAEDYFHVLKTKDIIKDKLKLFQDVAAKHGIYSVSDLDEVLNNIKN